MHGGVFVLLKKCCVLFLFLFVFYLVYFEGGLGGIHYKCEINRQAITQ